LRQLHAEGAVLPLADALGLLAALLDSADGMKQRDAEEVLLVLPLVGHLIEVEALDAAAAAKLAATLQQLWQFAAGGTSKHRTTRATMSVQGGKGRWDGQQREAWKKDGQGQDGHHGTEAVADCLACRLMLWYTASLAFAPRILAQAWQHPSLVEVSLRAVQAMDRVCQPTSHFNRRGLLNPCGAVLVHALEELRRRPARPQPPPDALVGLLVTLAKFGAYSNSFLRAFDAMHAFVSHTGLCEAGQRSGRCVAIEERERAAPALSEAQHGGMGCRECEPAGQSACPRCGAGVSLYPGRPTGG
jgi:hypothetical protein